MPPNDTRRHELQLGLAPLHNKYWWCALLGLITHYGNLGFWWIDCVDGSWNDLSFFWWLLLLLWSFFFFSCMWILVIVFSWKCLENVEWQRWSLKLDVSKLGSSKMGKLRASKNTWKMISCTVKLNIEMVCQPLSCHRFWYGPYKCRVNLLLSNMWSLFCLIFRTMVLLVVNVMVLHCEANIAVLKV